MDNLENELKSHIIKALDLEDISVDDIGDDEVLFDEGLGLDSIDALEIGVMLKQQYKLVTKGLSDEQMRTCFYSIKTLAAFIREQAVNSVKV